MLFGHDACFLRYCARFAEHLLRASGLLLNSKSVLIPACTITWLGKVLNNCPANIANDPARVAAFLLSLFRFFIKPFTKTALRKIFGMLQWLSRPAPQSAIFLASCYHLLQRNQHPNYFPLPLWSSLIQATLLCLIPAVPRKQPPPLTFPPLFTDAAEETDCKFRVGMARGRHYCTSTVAPSWVTNQQVAEIYGVFHGLRQAALRQESHVCCIVDNAGAFFIIKKGRTSFRNRGQLRVLRRLWRIVHQYNLHVAIALTRSKNNPADFLSRLHTYPLQDVVAKSQDVFPLEHSFPASSLLHRFWHRPSTSPVSPPLIIA